MPDRVEEILIRLPKNLVHEVHGITKREQRELEEFFYQATKYYVKYKKETLMQKGYQEMSSINLELCSEAFLAEEEANHTANRSVIGV